MTMIIDVERRGRKRKKMKEPAIFPSLDLPPLTLP